MTISSDPLAYSNKTRLARIRSRSDAPSLRRGDMERYGRAVRIGASTSHWREQLFYEKAAGSFGSFEGATGRKPSGVPPSVAAACPS